MRLNEIIMLSGIVGCAFFQGFFLVLKTLIFGINAHDANSEPYSWSWVHPPKSDIECGNITSAIDYVYRSKILSLHSYKIRITRILYFVFFPVLLLYYIVHTIGMLVGIVVWYIGNRIVTWAAKPI